MAEIFEEIDEQGEIEAVEHEQQIQQEPEEQEVKQPDIPEKYKGKALEDVVRMHQEAEKLISRQAQEVGEVRKLADELLKSQLEKKAEETEPQEVDFFENPQEAIRQAVANSPDVIQAKQYSIMAQQERARQMLAQKHPDSMQIVQDDEFVEWVKSSPIRTQLFKMADAFDVNAADELFSTFKQLKTVKQVQVSQAENAVEKAAREKTLNSASVDTSGTGESSKPIYRRAKLLEMQLRRPDEYRVLADSGELAQAYLEGRVR